MNFYEQKQQARKERYQSLAQSNGVKADLLYESAKKSLEIIPFGQPILVGHHSERSDRNYRNRAHNKMSKSFELQEKSEYYAEKAQSVGTNGISSDDPEAITKLKEKLVALENTREQYKQHNKEQKNKGGEAMPSFYLSNLGANIRSVKQRIELLERKQSMEVRPDIVGAGFVLKENKEINRIQFIFNVKPSVEIRAKLKMGGFRWSPYNNAWQAYLTNRGRYQADNIIKSL